MYAIKNGINMVWNVLQSITFMDIIDMLLMSYLIYIKFIKETRAGQLVKGILFIAAAYLVSTFIGLKSISYIVKSILNVGILAILIMFQPEIRRALEKAGRTKLGVNLFNFSASVFNRSSCNKINVSVSGCAEPICQSHQLPV